MDVAELQRQLMGLELEHPLMNGAGVCKRPDGKHGWRALLHSSTAAIVIGSVTSQAREGNAGSNYYWDAARGFSLNALGLPNPGIDYYLGELPSLLAEARETHPGRPIGVSIAGFNPEDFGILAEQAAETGVDFLEANPACPNVRDGGKPHRVICYDSEALDESLTQIGRRVGTNIPVSVKLSPLLDNFDLRDRAQIIAGHTFVRAVVAINTVAGGYAPHPGDPTRAAIDTPLGGIAGPAIKPIALGQIRQLRAALPDHIQIIGVGGIQTGEDVRDFLEAGADAVQIVTSLLEGGTHTFERILGELVA